MSGTSIDRLIINSPYEEPRRHWRYDRETRLFELAESRRPASYVVASASSPEHKANSGASRSRSWTTAVSIV